LNAALRNFEFFDAPHVAYICMAKSFGIGVALDVGMYVQTLMLAMQSRGISSCAQASLRSFPELAAEQLGIPDDEQILCGLSFGYEDPTVPANQTRQPRGPIESNVFFRGDVG
jgi:nitroreductase